MSHNGERLCLKIADNKECLFLGVNKLGIIWD